MFIAYENAPNDFKLYKVKHGKQFRKKCDASQMIYSILLFCQYQCSCWLIPSGDETRLAQV